MLLVLPTLTALTACNPPFLNHDLPVCPPKQDQSHHLCVGISTLLTTRCANLHNTTFLQQIICDIGVGSLGQRTAGIYGATTSKCVRNYAMDYNSAGLHQQPAQLAGALIAISSHGVSSYLELGVGYGQTAVFMAA